MSKRPGVVKLHPAYVRRDPCPICRTGRAVVTPRGEGNLAQGRVR